MAISLKESFQVKAPIDQVWRFLLDPQQVVLCMPGAHLEEVVGDDTFLGNIRVKVGPITTSYKGRVQFIEVDDQQYVIQMVAEGLEASGGTAKGTMSSRLRALPDGRTEVLAEASAEITGRIVQFGRGMIQGVSQQLFQEFAAAVRERLEAPPGAAGQEALATSEKQPIRVLPLVFGYLWSAVVRFFRRLLRRSVNG